MNPVERPILDYGKVVLLDVFGSDARIAESARVSYGKGTKKISNDDALIRYLVRHRHTSPLEMCEVLFYLKVPIFVARQLVRHRTANINEVSGRYSELPNECYLPDVEQCGPQATNNKQGRSEVTNEIKAKKARQDMRFASEQSHDAYDRLLNVHGVSKEISRTVLPLGTYTEMYWKTDLHNFFHFCKLRMDAHAQYEIRVMANAMFDAVAPHFPSAARAFTDYILHAKTLSASEQRLLALMSSAPVPSWTYAQSLGMSEREYNEFTAWITEMQASSTGE